MDDNFEKYELNFEQYRLRPEESFDKISDLTEGDIRFVESDSIWADCNGDLLAESDEPTYHENDLPDLMSRNPNLELSRIIVFEQGLVVDDSHKEITATQNFRFKRVLESGYNRPDTNTICVLWIKNSVELEHYSKLIKERFGVDIGPSQITKFARQYESGLNMADENDNEE